MYDGPLTAYEDGRPQAARWERGEEVSAAGANDGEVAVRLEMLRVEHRDLDAAIDALRATAAPDQLQIARLKKRKLRLRDEIALLEDLAVPDIIA